MSFANDDVLKFYKELPFNIFGSKEEHQKFMENTGEISGLIL